MQSKTQQIQFFNYCLLPMYEDDTSQIDLRAEIDSTLTTGENWNRLQEKYGLGDQRLDPEDYREMELRYLAKKVRDETGLDVSYEEVQSNIDTLEGLEESSPSFDSIGEALASD